MNTSGIQNIAVEEIDNSDGSVQLRISKLRLQRGNILRIDIVPNELFNLSDAREVVAAAGRMGEGRAMANLIVIGEHTTADHEARAYASSEEGCKYKIADAFVLRSLPQMLVGNFYLKFHKPARPTKIFTSEEDAVTWLMQLA
jgi:hypothetical protein